MYKTQFSYKEVATGKQIIEVNQGVDGKSGISAAEVGTDIAALLAGDGKTVKVISIAVQPIPVQPAAVAAGK